jgi:glutaredoxin 3
MIDENTIAQPKITVYSTPTCPYCVMAKRYLSEKGIAYEDVDVSRDQKRAFEMLTKSGQMGVPVLDIGGQVIVGFDRHAIDGALMIRK